jgi:hypothetical protein
MTLIIIIIVLLLLFGGGGGYYAHRSYGTRGLGGVLGIVVVVLILLWRVAQPLGLSNLDYGLADRRQRNQRQLHVLPGERDADQCDREAYCQHDMVQGEPPAGEDEPDDVEQKAGRAVVAVDHHLAERPIGEAGDPEGRRRSSRRR